MFVLCSLCFVWVAVCPRCLRRGVFMCARPARKLRPAPRPSSSVGTDKLRAAAGLQASPIQTDEGCNRGHCRSPPDAHRAIAAGAPTTARPPARLDANNRFLSAGLFADPAAPNREAQRGRVWRRRLCSPERTAAQTAKCTATWQAGRTICRPEKRAAGEPRRQAAPSHRCGRCRGCSAQSTGGWPGHAVSGAAGWCLANPSAANLLHPVPF